MKMISLVLAILSLSLLSACTAGVSVKIPQSSQVKFNLPSGVRSCRYAPKAPDSGASKKRIARYVVELRSSWSHCYRNLKTVDQLYREYQEKLGVFTSD